MAQHANAMNTSSGLVSTGPRPASVAPDRTIQGDTPGELNLWLFVTVIPVTFVAILVALVMIIPH